MCLVGFILFNTIPCVVAIMTSWNYFDLIGKRKETAGETPGLWGAPLKLIVLDLGDAHFIWLDNVSDEESPVMFLQPEHVSDEQREVDAQRLFRIRTIILIDAGQFRDIRVQGAVEVS